MLYFIVIIPILRLFMGDIYAFYWDLLYILKMLKIFSNIKYNKFSK
jgi:hypothetical protein